MNGDKGDFHVFITTAWFPDATSTSGVFVKEQGEAIARAGHKVTILVITSFAFGAWMKKMLKGERNTFESSNEVEIVIVNAIFFFPLRFFRNKNLQMKKRILNRVWKKLKGYAMTKGKPDIVHHHCLSDNAYVGAFLAEKWNIPYVFTEHSPYSTDEELNKFNTIEDFDDRKKFVNGAKERIAVSKYWADRYGPIYGAPYCVVPNLVNEIFEGKINSAKDKGFVFVCVAGLNWQKNHKCLIPSFARKFKGNENVILKLAGSGPFEERLKKLAIEQGVEKQIFFLGKLNREEVIQLFDRSHVAVLSSFMETFGIVLAEAMFRGLPVVSTASGGPEEFINPENGLMAKYNDQEDLGDKLEEMYLHYNRYDGVKISEWAKGKFSEKIIVEKIIAVYSRACNTGN